MSGIYGIQFPKNDNRPNSDGTMVAIWFPNPQSNGLPIWGPSNAGVTIVRRVRPSEPNNEAGGTKYNQMFWWSNTSGFVTSGDTFMWNNGSSNSYWGFHLYPTAQDLPMRWEVAVQGRDDILNRNSAEVNPTYDQWYTQGLRIQYGVPSANLVTLTFYLDLPSTANGVVIDSVMDSAGWGDPVPPNPGTVIGDSPWFSNYQHESFAGVQGEIKIFATLLSEADMLSEASDFTQIMTSAGNSSKWWCKNGFSSLDDLAGDLGTSGITWQWWDTGNKGSLFAMGPEPQTRPIRTVRSPMLFRKEGSLYVPEKKIFLPSFRPAFA